MIDAEQDELIPINYQGLNRLVSRMKWSATERPLPEVLPLQHREQPAISPLTTKDAYHQARNQEIRFHETQSVENGARLSTLRVHDLEAQYALLNPEHELNAIMQRITDRLGKAERILQERGMLTRRETSDQYNIYITVRDIVNAWTYQHGKTTFVEAGFLSMMDKYLREVKHLPGISEDHIAGLLAHEVSHTDNEAQQSYMNEEYCDAQGVILSAEAGYNPKAMIDVEDFLIYLEKEANFYHDADAAAQSGTKKHAFLPTHPPSENRRLVIINMLKNTEGAIPNQTHDYTQIDKTLITDLDKRMREWVNERQHRIFLSTREDCLRAIDNARNETEVAEAMMGYELFRRAELTRVVAENDDFETVSILVDALSTEIRERCNSHKETLSFRKTDGSYLQKDTEAYVGDNREDAYKRGHILIGGLAQSMNPVTEADIITKATDAVKALIDECEHLDPHLRTPYQQTPYYENRRRLTDQERQIRKQQLDDEQNQASQQKSQTLKDLINFVLANRESFDLPAILAGDFTSAPELQKRLEQFGIKDFRHYLKKLQRTFRSLDINHAMRNLASEKMLEILPDPVSLLTPVEKMTPQDIQSLLNSTRYYRAALVVDARFGNSVQFDNLFNNDQFSLTYHEHIKKKMSQIAYSYSLTPEEQHLLEKLFLLGSGEVNEARYGRTDAIVNQLLASAVSTSEDWDGTTSITPFKSTLTNNFFSFRIAPSPGGDLLEYYVVDSSNHNNPAERILSQWSSLSHKIDTIRAYHGEATYQEEENEWGAKYYRIRTKLRDIPGLLDLAHKRRTTIPVMQDDIIAPQSRFEDLKTTEIQTEPRALWETMKLIAERSGFEHHRVEDLVLIQGVPADEKVAYFRQMVQEGKMTYEQVFNAAIIHENRYVSERRLYQNTLFTYEAATNLRTGYEVATKLLQTLPLSPSYQNIDVSKLCQELYETKVKIALLERAGAYSTPPDGKKPHEAGVQLDDKGLFSELPPHEQAARQLDFIFEFVKEGGTICLSEQNQLAYGNNRLIISGMMNEGADVNILGILRNLHYPSSLVEQKVREILTINKKRFTALEVDKWENLIAFCKQPYLYYDSQVITPYGQEPKPWRVRLGGTDLEQAYDPYNIDHLLKVIDEVMMLPVCSYRDHCIGLLIKQGSDINYQKEFTNHPGREYYEKRLTQIAASAFSDIGLRRYEDPRPVNKQLFNYSNDYIPRSERFINDPLGGFYLGNTEAVESWSRLINSEGSYCIRSVFSRNYREELRQQGITGVQAELRILSDRMRILNEMPESQLKEALTLYAIRSAQDHIGAFSGQEKEQLISTVRSSVNNTLPIFTSEQGRQHIFDIKFRADIGIMEGPISPEVLRNYFPTREEYIKYVTDFLPSKSAARDGYIILAVEAYHMKVQDAHLIRSLMFANDYSTSDEQVSSQRAGMEFIRTIKLNEHITKQDIRELILWIIDDKRQVRAADDFFMNISNDKAGRKLIKGLMEQLKIGPYKEREDSREQSGLAVKIADVEGEVLTRSLLQLPRPMKRVIVRRLIFETLSTSILTDEQRNAILLRSGMPTILGKLTADNSLMQRMFGSLTFNSIIEERGVESPLRREMFFDLVLGKKGILEEPIKTSASDFNDRLRRNFDGSQMHAFIDDVLEIAFRNGKWDRKSQDVARIVAHSFIEAVEPTRRATVLFNLLSELPKIDFNDPDKNKVQSRFLQTALSSIGVLGAKLGQIDELIPKGWGSEMSSLKHSTKPMSKLMVADIFIQEGLSGDYVIKSSAGAASTACGYIVETPLGEEQFAKVLRPEVKLEWQGDFIAVRHMLDCLKGSGYLEIETEPIMQQIEKLVREELQTQREIENVMYYIQAETSDTLHERGGIRPVEMPKERIASSGEIVPHPAESLVIFEELLPKSQYIELSKINADLSTLPPELASVRESVNMNSIYKTVVQDFLYRAFIIGSWHSDLHDGNILVARDGSNMVAREITGKDLVLIDFGQTGRAETEEKKLNAARFFIGLALRDRSLVAQAIYNALETPIPIEEIEKELGINPFRIQERVTSFMAQHQTNEYLTNFLKASINILPYLRRLPVTTQFDLISPYITEEDRRKGWVRIQEAVATKNFTRLFL